MPVDYIQQLEDTSSRLEKEAILEQAWQDGCYELFHGFQLAYDSLVTFGVKKVPEIQELDDFEGSFHWQDFLNLAEQLRTRQLTGNAARDTLHEAAKEANALMWNKFFRRILLKDLRCGVSDKTVNKVLKKMAKKDKKALEYVIDVFSVQLATAEEIDNITGRVFVDPKLDGVRITAVLDKDLGTVVLYTRNGKINTNFKYVEESLLKLLPELPGSMVLDGEMVSQSFQELMTQVNRKEKVDTRDARFALFDVLPLPDFRRGISKIPLEERHNALVALEPIFQTHCRVQLKTGEDSQNVYVVPKLEVDVSTEDGMKNLSEFNQQTLEAGFEGVMVKMPDSPYERKRSKSWLKIKPVIEVSLEIVDVEEGTGRNKGRLGNIVCKGEDLGYKIWVSVGSGYSDEQRDQFWENKAELIGQIAEIRADIITHSAGDGEWYSLRFPRFLRFRGVEPGEKL